MYDNTLFLAAVAIQLWTYPMLLFHCHYCYKANFDVHNMFGWLIIGMLQIAVFKMKSIFSYHANVNAYFLAMLVFLLLQ